MSKEHEKRAVTSHIDNQAAALVSAISLRQLAIDLNVQPFDARQRSGRGRRSSIRTTSRAGVSDNSG
jgi:hypothetical protein